MPTLDEARKWYDPTDPVHGFDHVVRVLRLAERLAAEVGADMEIVRAAALLHDASGAAPGTSSGGRAVHECDSASLAAGVLRGEGWPEERIDAVMECIRAHRFRGSRRPVSLEAQVLFDADKLDVMGAFGAARTIGYAVQAGQPIYTPPSETFLQTGETEPGEAHSAYHEYLFKLRRVRERLNTEAARRMGARRHAALVAFFQQMDAEARGLDAPPE